MSRSIAGLNRILLADSTHLVDTQAGLVSIGLRKPSNMEITPFKSPEDQRKREFRNKTNFKFTGESYQLRMRDIEELIGFCQNGFDSQVLREKQNATTDSGGLFNFTGNYQKGLDFEHKLSNDDRNTMVTIEGAEEFENAQTLIDAADAAGAVLPNISAITSVGSNQKGNAKALYAHPWYSAFESPAATALFSKKEIVSRSFSIKTIGDKNEYNETLVDWLEIMAVIRSKDATIANIITLFDKGILPSLTVKEMLTATLYEKWVIPAEVLSLNHKFDLGDEKSEAECTFVGRIPLLDISFAYGTANGGAGIPTTELEYRQGGTATVAA